MGIDKRNLEKLLEKLINRREYDCPDCETPSKWTLMPPLKYEKKESIIYCCSDCKNEFQYFDIHSYNNRRDK